MPAPPVIRTSLLESLLSGSPLYGGYDKFVRPPLGVCIAQDKVPSGTNDGISAGDDALFPATTRVYFNFSQTCLCHQGRERFRGEMKYVLRCIRRISKLG